MIEKWVCDEEEERGMNKCSKCNGEMQEGYLPGHHFPAMWAKGAPDLHKRSWMFPYPRLKKYDPRKAMVVATYRCSQCGFLESYAKE